MAALHDGDWETAEVSTAAHRSHASGLVAAHLQWHLERRLRTLPLVERVQQRPAGRDVGAEAQVQPQATGSDG